MRNVCFFNTVRFWGGGEKLHLEYALKFKERDYHVCLATGKGSPLALKAEQAGLGTFNMHAGNLSFLNPLKYLRLYRFYKTEKIDTVIFSGSPDLKLGGFAAKLAGVANIVYLRGLAAPVKNSLINRILFSRVLTHIVANSEATRKTILQNLKPTVDPCKVKVIYHGIDLELFDSRTGKETPAVFLGRPGIFLGNAGRLTSQKGQQYLVELAHMLKLKNISFTLFIAGTGEMKPELEKLISRYDLQKEVVLMGFVEEVESFMHAIDIFILTSLWEGFGYVIVEAMAACKPAIAFDISSNPEIIEDNHTGLLVDFPDMEMFCNKVESLIRDESLRHRFGRNGRERVEKYFQLDDRITEFEHCLLNGQASGSIKR
ncbi:MAG: glycosyltransferase family 4 protein [Bacteroidota bacterium]